MRPTPTLAFVLALCALAPAHAAAPCRPAPRGPITHAYASLPGVPADLLSFDLYLPAGCGAAPVVVWVHGGGWRTGDKAGVATREKATFVGGLGYALAAVNYRLSTPGSGVRWPDQGQDVAAALAFLVAQGPALGLDATRMALVGHSAGAHVVAILAADPDLLAAVGLGRDTLDGVVALDTEGFDLATSAAARTGLVANAFGADPDVIADASPAVQVARHGAPAAPFLVVTRGTAARRATAEAFVALVNERGGDATLLDASPYTHADVNRRLGEPGETRLTPAVATFLERVLADR